MQQARARIKKRGLYGLLIGGCSAQQAKAQLEARTHSLIWCMHSPLALMCRTHPRHASPHASPLASCLQVQYERLGAKMGGENFLAPVQRVPDFLEGVRAWQPVCNMLHLEDCLWLGLWQRALRFRSSFDGPPAERRE